MTDIYKNLANHLDRLPGGFPETESGIELRILKKLFTREEAEIAVALNMLPEPAGAIAARLETPADRLQPQLEAMSSKGLIFSVDKKEPLFMAAQFVIGIWEYHVNSLDEELIRDFNAYIPHLAKQWSRQKTNQLRVVPISKSLSVKAEIMPYDEAERIIRRTSKITVAPCICRKEHRISGQGCDNPLEVCLIFGSGAYYYEKNGLGRPIEQKEALEILKTGMDAGLVLQPGNAKRAMNICMCCGCCCQVLKNMKKLPSPAASIHSNYYAVVDPQACIACGNCIERCHMDAIAIDEAASVDLNRCIGCGACVPVCDVEAMALEGKPAGQQHEPPKNVFETYLRIARERGSI